MTASDLGAFMQTMVAPSHRLSPGTAADLAREHFGLDATAAPLTGERDENFRLAARDGTCWVLKVASPQEDPSITRMQIEAMLHVEREDPTLPCPRVRRTRDGDSQVEFRDDQGATRMVRVVNWLPGVPLRETRRTARQRAGCGRLVARMALALRGFDHPAATRSIAWDLRNIPLLPPLLFDLPDLPQADFIGWFIAWFAAQVAHRLDEAPRQFVHNDFNDRNVLVDPSEPDRIAGVIDFGDAVRTARIADLAIAAVAHATAPESAQDEIREVAAACHAVAPFSRAEQDLLGPLVAARVVTGILIPAWHRARNPGLRHYDEVRADHIARRVALARSLMHARFLLDR